MTQQEKRRHKRVEWGAPGIIVLERGHPDLKCVITDLSIGGAKLSGIAVENIPNEFGLRLTTSKGSVKRCRVMWRREQQVGIQFAEPFATLAKLIEATQSQGGLKRFFSSSSQMYFFAIVKADGTIVDDERGVDFATGYEAVVFGRNLAHDLASEGANYIGGSVIVRDGKGRQIERLAIRQMDANRPLRLDEHGRRQFFLHKV